MPAVADYCNADLQNPRLMSDKRLGHVLQPCYGMRHGSTRWGYKENMLSVTLDVRIIYSAELIYIINCLIFAPFSEFFLSFKV